MHIYLPLFVIGTLGFATTLPTIAVADIPLQSGALHLGEGFPADVWTTQDRLLSHDLVRVLKRMKMFTVVDRSFDDLIARERLLVQAHNPQSADTGTLGRFKAAQYLVMGEVESVEASIQTKPVPGSKRHTYSAAQGHVRMHVRVVDTRDGRVAAAETVVVSRENNQSQPMMFLEELRAEAVVRVVNLVVDTVYPLRLARIDTAEGRAYISRGSESGLHIGDEITVVREGEEILDPETGRSLGFASENLCVVTVREVQAHFSVVGVPDVCPDLAVGMLCRRQ